ncbi:MAG: hypothetical protein CL928_13775 [Deltaproteobacteria bacterium]|nr:hypothetical protein [Deltaproteobacteria bacterium]
MLRQEGIAREPIDDREVVDDMVRRALRRLEGAELDILLNECCFLEEKRLGQSNVAGDVAQLKRLREVRRRLAWANEQELRTIVESIVRGYAAEIHGHFDLGTYANATRALPAGLALVLGKQKPWAVLRQAMGGESSLATRVRCSGAVASFDRLVERGTCVLVPTHLSNLDSPVIGLALHQAGLPPMIYGAGINLFNNWLLSWFMDHLGAYKVDRAKRHKLYKEVLKEYSTMALERRWHSLFFPGGTRSRSGGLERQLKKGLMGTALEAYQRNIQAGVDLPRLYFIPATINYRLVLEAETLIEDHLQEAGRSRYIITDDEFARPERVLQYVRNMLGLDDPIDVVFGSPIDPFGNPVNEDGDSLDPHGRPFDPAGYLLRDGAFVADPQRDRLYTGRLSEAIASAFARETVLYETHILAAAMHRRLEANHPSLDTFRRLLLGPESRTLPHAEVEAEVALVQRALCRLETRGEVRLGHGLADLTPSELRQRGEATFGLYHERCAVHSDSGASVLADPKLALYYANRLAGYSLPPAGPAGMTG